MDAVLIFFGTFLFAFGREILPPICACRDWHGGCRRVGDNWTDNGTWIYRCAFGASNGIFDGCQITSQSGEIHQIQTGTNRTVDGFWANCEADEIRQKLEIEPKCAVVGEEFKHIGETFRKGIFQWICAENGRKVNGCYYRNETDDWNLLKVGEVTHIGLIRHSCDRYRENPGVVQYHSEIREDLPYESPSNKGINKMLPDFVDKRLRNIPTERTHQNVALFIADVPKANVRIRYLPSSRKIDTPTKAN
uniref:Uncharacterized protein n=1 Tax=Globodera rostochiensis TaxID=31243 RepID=A0A914HYJ3_GLORO